MNTIGVAIIGAGYWGANLIRNFATLPGADLLYICDLDPRRLEIVAQQYPHITITTSISEVLSNPQVQAVVIATPAESHREVAELCLKAKKDVFVEKPLATSNADAQAVIRLAAAVDRLLMVGHLFIYDVAIRTAIKLVQGGKVGDIRYLTSIRTSMGGTARLDTNIVWDALIHDAYILTALIGRPPRRVQANGRGYLSDLEDVVFATFDFGDKIIADCYASWYALEKARRLTIVGSQGILHLDEFADSKLTYYQRRYVPSTEYDPRGRPRWRWVDEGQEVQPLREAQPLRVEAEHFIECVRMRKEPLTTGNVALSAVAIIEACQASLASDGIWVAVEDSHA